MQIKGSNNRLALRALLGARASRRAWRTSTPSWAARRCASSSAAGGRRTPRSQRGRAGDPDTQGKRSQHRLGVAFAFGILVHCFWCCIGCFHFLHFDITSQLLEVGVLWRSSGTIMAVTLCEVGGQLLRTRMTGVPPTHPRRPRAGWWTSGPPSASGPTSRTTCRRR